MREKDEFHPINTDGPLPFYARKISPKKPSEIFLIRLDSIQDSSTEIIAAGDSSEIGTNLYPSDIFEPKPGKEVKALINGEQKLVSFEEAAKIAQER